MFQFTASTSSPSIGAQVTGSALLAEADFVKQVPAGLNNAILGIITLDATQSNQAITLSQVPISVAASGGATLDALTDCALTSTTGTSLTTGGNALGAIAGANVFKLDTPLNVAAGQGALLVLRCNVSANAPVGSMLTIGSAPASFQATVGGSPVTVTQGMMANGQEGTNAGVISIAAEGSQSASVSGTTSVSTPGVPNTGAGGDAPMLYAILIASLLAAIVAGREVLRTH
jgi:hypothetical protein